MNTKRLLTVSAFVIGFAFISPAHAASADDVLGAGQPTETESGAERVQAEVEAEEEKEVRLRSCPRALVARALARVR